MAELEKKNAQSRILYSAISLFSAKGYSGVGIREIAQTANVNISMISYYFQGKTGIIKSILTIFFEKLFTIFDSISCSMEKPDLKVRLLVESLVTMVRENTDLTIVCYNELPLDIPEINDLKTENTRKSVSMMLGLLKELGIQPDDKQRISIIGPSLISIIFSHFRMRPILNSTFDIDLDDTFYAEYADTIATMFLSGIEGILSRPRLTGE